MLINHKLPKKVSENNHGINLSSSLSLSHLINMAANPRQIQDVKGLHQALASHLLPKSAQVHRHIKDFLAQEIADFERINSKNDVVYEEMRSEWDQYNKAVTELKTKKNKDSKFIEGGSGYLRIKDDEIKNKAKVLESISTGMKESVGKVNPEKLSQLPYEKEPILKDLFSTLYQVLYNEPASKYNWPDFKKLALIHRDGEDFLTRLVNVNFKELSDQHYDALRIIKGDEKFKDVCQNSLFAVTVVDLADWIDYTVEGRKINLEKKQCETEYDKIRKDIDRRSDGTLQFKEQFCNQALKDIDSYQNDLSNLESELRTLIVGMKSGVSQLSEIEDKRNDKIRLINAL